MTETAVQTVGLEKHIHSSFLRKRTPVLRGVNLKIDCGETYGLLGPNGAGKTTTLKILLGLMRASNGEVNVLGSRPGDPKVLRRIGFLPESPYFYAHLTGLEFLHFIAQLFGISGQTRKERIGQLLDLVGMSNSANQPMRKYSKGMLQRLGIAQSLINDPELIFWDEPMSGLDPIGRRDVRKILKFLKSSGKTVLFSSHLLPDVAEVCDRVGVLCKGKVIGEERVQTISATGSYLDLEDYFLRLVGEDSAKQSH